jgi:hypothetical protein
MAVVLHLISKNKALAEDLINEAKPLKANISAKQVDIKDFEAVKTWVEEVKKRIR